MESLSFPLEKGQRYDYFKTHVKFYRSGDKRVGTLDTDQRNQLQAIGTYLSEVRLEQDRSLEDIAAKTYIPLRLLKALEAGQEKILPEPVFIQGFIRRYADALGLNGLELAQQFPIETASTEPDPKSDPQRERVEPANPIYQPSSWGEEKPASRPSWLYWIGGLVGLLAIVSLLNGLLKPKQPQTAAVRPQSTASSSTATGIAPVKPPSPSPSPVTASPSPTTAVSPSPTPTVSPSPEAIASPSPPSSNAVGTAAAPVVVDVKLSDASWMQVMTDGNVTFEGTLPKGTQRTWTAKREIVMVSGNAGAVAVAFNKGNAQVMGKPGMVEERTFKASASSPASN